MHFTKDIFIKICNTVHWSQPLPFLECSLEVACIKLVKYYLWFSLDLLNSVEIMTFQLKLHLGKQRICRGLNLANRRWLWWGAMTVLVRVLCCRIANALCGEWWCIVIMEHQFFLVHSSGILHQMSFLRHLEISQ